MMYDDYDYNIISMYPASIYPESIIFQVRIKKFVLLDTVNDWYKIRVYSTLVEQWILTQEEDCWDEAASDKKIGLGDGINYWVTGKLYTFMVTKWG